MKPAAPEMRTRMSVTYAWIGSHDGRARSRALEREPQERSDEHLIMTVIQPVGKGRAAAEIDPVHGILEIEARGKTVIAKPDHDARANHQAILGPLARHCYGRGERTPGPSDP